VRPKTKIVLGLLAVLVASTAFVGAALAQSSDAPPDGAIPFAEVDGMTLYVDPNNLPDGFDEEFVTQLGQMDPAAREDALEARFNKLKAEDPGHTGSGSSLTGTCGGFAYSFNDKGVLIDAAMDSGDDSAPVSLMDGGQAFTSDNPFTVHNQGSVVYMGFVEPPPIDHTWSVSVSVLGTDITVDSGGHPNEGEHNRNFGTVDLGQDFPLKIQFTAKITGQFDSANGVHCAGSGWVEVTGETNILITLGAALLALIGVAGILFNARPARTWKG
jgi:hypothetical protein